MSDRMTSVGPREAPENQVRVLGIQDWGRVTRPEMIRRFREHYARQLAEAQAALALADDDLIVETFLGTWAQRNRAEVTR